MTIAENARDQVRVLHGLAASSDARHIKDLLIHLAEQCERMAEKAEGDLASNGL